MRIPARANLKGFTRKYLRLDKTGIFHQNEYEIAVFFIFLPEVNIYLTRGVKFPYMILMAKTLHK